MSYDDVLRLAMEPPVVGALVMHPLDAMALGYELPREYWRLRENVTRRKRDRVRRRLNVLRRKGNLIAGQLHRALGFA